MAVRKQPEEHELERVPLADDRAFDLVEEACGVLSELVYGQRERPSSRATSLSTPAKPIEPP
jgi:hypothetical protein